ncbi:MAG: metallophosphoesterase [Candidatus Riflebacteria bacterium]|nr:metallophosphoesterase [Candidatus Riflebacteria bacterium]
MQPTCARQPKRLLIGDIHGCFRELQDLLDEAGLAESDEIIALGDIVDRGPDSVRVLDFVAGLELPGNAHRDRSGHDGDREDP